MLDYTKSVPSEAKMLIEPWQVNNMQKSRLADKGSIATQAGKITKKIGGRKNLARYAARIVRIYQTCI